MQVRHLMNSTEFFGRSSFVGCYALLPIASFTYISLNRIQAYFK